jgi:hypothetical protein
MGRRTRTQLPTSEHLLKFKPSNPVSVQARLEEYRKQQKTFYDRTAKPLGVLKEGDVVRMKTDKGFQRKAIVEKPLSEPRSYLVNSNGTFYRRNRNHLLKTYEGVNKSTAENTITAENTGVGKHTKSKLEDSEPNEVVTTRYGLAVKKSVRFTLNDS